MSVAPRQTSSKKDAPPTYKEALARVGGRPSRIENIARWLVDFSFKSTENFSQRNWEDLLWECAAFFYGEHYTHREGVKSSPEKMAAALVVQKLPWSLGSEIGSLPSMSDLKAIQNWLHNFWDDLKKNGWVSITTAGWTATLSVKSDGALVGFSSPLASSWLQRFSYRAYGVLTSSDIVNRVRFCKSDKCRRPFLSIKRQVFCSVSCSQRHRTSLYRTKNRQQFREKRREYYKKKQRERIGLPNLRIQTRKGVRP